MSDQNPELYIGTNGAAAWLSRDFGGTLTRVPTAKGDFKNGLYYDGTVFVMAFDPADPAQVLVGTNEGLYRLDRRDPYFYPVPSPMDGMSVWSIAFSPHEPGVVLAGAHPAGIYRSADAGKTWSKLDTSGFPETCPPIKWPRVTSIRFAADDPKLIFASLEIAGIWRSHDGGKSWSKASGKGLYEITEDMHDLAVVQKDGHRLLYLAANRGFFVSSDDGESWAQKSLPTPRRYCRRIVPHPTVSGTAFLSNGDGVPGTTGGLFISRDWGETWTDAGLPGTPNSTLWSIAVHPAQPDTVFVATVNGEMYGSRDAGRTWQKFARELGEIRSVQWVPPLN